jgi:hypothetical protein
MRFDMDFIFFILICLDRDTFWSIDIDLVRESDSELDLAWSLDVELVSDSDDLERLGISI